ncbi:hypothetical protein ACVWWG_000069 [Bradyrhizobium sp. LB7.2]
MLAKLSFSDLADFLHEKFAGISGVGASNEPSGSSNRENLLIERHSLEKVREPVPRLVFHITTKQRLDGVEVQLGSGFNIASRPLLYDSSGKWRNTERHDCGYRQAENA